MNAYDAFCKRCQGPLLVTPSPCPFCGYPGNVAPQSPGIAIGPYENGPNDVAIYGEW